MGRMSQPCEQYDGPSGTAPIEHFQLHTLFGGDHLYAVRGWVLPGSRRLRGCEGRQCGNHRDYAKEHGVGDADALNQGMQAKAAEFLATGAELYREECTLWKSI